jgi:hypothetical protein
MAKHSSQKQKQNKKKIKREKNKLSRTYIMNLERIIPVKKSSEKQKKKKTK